MGDALNIPSLGKHVHTHDAAHVLSGLPLRANRIDHLAQDSFVALIGVEDF